MGRVSDIIVNVFTKFYISTLISLVSLVLFLLIEYFRLSVFSLFVYVVFVLFFIFSLFLLCENLKINWKSMKKLSLTLVPVITFVEIITSEVSLVLLNIIEENVLESIVFSIVMVIPSVLTGLSVSTLLKDSDEG